MALDAGQLPASTSLWEVSYTALDGDPDTLGLKGVGGHVC